MSVENERLDFGCSQRVGHGRCPEQARLRLTVTVSDKGSTFSHDYCRRHGEQARTIVEAAAATAHRGALVTTELHRIGWAH